MAKIVIYLVIFLKSSFHKHQQRYYFLEKILPKEYKRDVLKLPFYNILKYKCGIATRVHLKFQNEVFSQTHGELRYLTSFYLQSLPEL